MKPIRALLDAGHYGKLNQSPAVPEYYEAEAMWKLHLKLKDALERYGFEVDITRDDQTKDLAVAKRGEKAKGYDVFLSLHTDAVGNYVSKTDRVSVYGAFDGWNEAHVLGELLAETVAACMGVSKGVYKTKKSNKGDWDYYAVMRGARSVGCPLYYIVEHSFHTNENSSRWLLDDNNLERLADAEAEALAKYYGVSVQYELGDVNGDGEVNQYDYILLKRIVMGTYKPTEEELARCDINGDGKVDLYDYILLKRIVLGTYKPS